MSGLSIGTLINCFLIAGGLFALWKGGPAERAAAGLVILNAVLGEIAHRVAPSMELVLMMANDGVTALAVLGVTIRYGAPWMGGVMFFFAAQFALHSYYLVMDRSPAENLHALINNLNWSGITWCLIIGTAMAWRQRLNKHAAETAA